ncbi:MAG: IS200/IS605 family transposase [Clostridia bacterium]|nr:IS200/IS605 family transposase [Clostridia bacterium]
MSTFTQIMYQIVFSTYNREQTLNKNDRDELYRYITGVLNNKKCHLYRIGGVSDHLHILTHLHPAVALATLVKDIKLASTEHIKTQKLFPSFNGWQEGYSAFTYSYRDKDKIIEYIKNQEVHHQQYSFKEELIELLKEHGVEFDERYFL